MPPMNIREGIIIPSWPGLGVRVKEPIANSTSTKIAKAGLRLRATMRGADQLTVLDRGRDRASIHCIGSFCSCRKRELARTDRSEERSVGKDVSVRVDLGGRRIFKKKKQ